MIDRVGWRLLSAACKAFVARRLRLHVEGLEHLPEDGPFVIAARHYHHLYDGCILLATVPRPLQVMVGLDWVQDRRVRGLIEALCRLGRWPAVLRRDHLGRLERPGRRRNEDLTEDGGRHMRHALRLTSDLMGEGRGLLVFPEGYPNIDPFYTPKTTEEDFLPFRNGFAKLVRLAQRRSHRRIAVIPAGLSYAPGNRYEVTMRFGAARYLDRDSDVTAFAATIERQVRQLSGLIAAEPIAVPAAIPVLA